jgi:DNA-binding transcriptional LysR family regulator
MDWERVRLFLEVARAGQILKASKLLRLNHATVARQLTALEESLNAKLLERPFLAVPCGGERSLPRSGSSFGPGRASFEMATE